MCLFFIHHLILILHYENAKNKSKKTFTTFKRIFGFTKFFFFNQAIFIIDFMILY